MKVQLTKRNTIREEVAQIVAETKYNDTFVLSTNRIETTLEFCLGDQDFLGSSGIAISLNILRKTIPCERYCSRLTFFLYFTQFGPLTKQCMIVYKMEDRWPSAASFQVWKRGKSILSSAHLQHRALHTFGSPCCTYENVKKLLMTWENTSRVLFPKLLMTWGNTMRSGTLFFFLSSL